LYVTYFGRASCANLTPFKNVPFVRPVAAMSRV
jgi:hypothetical protein